MICSKCGAENPDGIRFCTSCGAPAAQSEPQTTPIQTNENANANAMDPNIPVFNQGVPPFDPNVMQPMPAPAPKNFFYCWPNFWICFLNLFFYY